MPTTHADSVGQVLVVDDDEFYRGALTMFFRGRGFTVKAAGTQAEALALATAERPDVAIIDIVIPRSRDGRYGQNLVNWRESAGIDLAMTLKRQMPEIGVVIFSGQHNRADRILRSLLEGMRGIAYKLKGCPPSELLEALMAVRRGRVVLDPEVTGRGPTTKAILEGLTDAERKLIDYGLKQFDRLTPRQREIACLVAASQGNANIAQQLNLSEGTVANYVSELYAQLGFNDPEYDHYSPRRDVLLAKLLLVRELDATVRPFRS